MAISFPHACQGGDDGRSAEENLRQHAGKSEVTNSEQDLGPPQERQPTMSDGVTAERPIEENGLRILAKSGAEIDYRSERDLISKIWESSIDTDGQPDCAVAVVLSIDDEELKRVQE